MKIICIGRNYREHIHELGNFPSKEPLLFLKPQSSLLDAGLQKQVFVMPTFSRDIRYETEVLVKIDKGAKNISSLQASQIYNEIGLGIDFTAADVQEQCKAKGHPWEKAKAFDHSAVVGRFINKKDLPSLKDLDFHLLKNNQLVQKGNTSQMLVAIDDLLSYASQFFTLEKGDIVFTGTPAGVSHVQKKDVLQGFLNNHFVFEVEVQ